MEQRSPVTGGSKRNSWASTSQEDFQADGKGLCSILSDTFAASPMGALECCECKREPTPLILVHVNLETRRWHVATNLNSTGGALILEGLREAIKTLSLAHVNALKWFVVRTHILIKLRNVAWRQERVWPWFLGGNVPETQALISGSWLMTGWGTPAEGGPVTVTLCFSDAGDLLSLKPNGSEMQILTWVSTVASYKHIPSCGLNNIQGTIFFSYNSVTPFLGSYPKKKTLPNQEMMFDAQSC